MKHSRKLVLEMMGIFVLCYVLACPALAASEIAGFIWGSSTLYETGYDYGAWCAQDHDTSTAWTEGAQGSGYGESLFMDVSPYTVVTGGVICTGYYASEDLFFKNAAPTRIYIRTGEQEAYLDVTEYANLYEPGFEGFHFRFDEPLVSDGTITMTIVGVREGWKYEDACISELRLEGYQASADTAPVIDSGTPHVSLVLPAEDDDADREIGEVTNGTDPTQNPDGLGGDGRGPDEIGTQDPEFLDADIEDRLVGLANALYKMHCEFAVPERLIISADDLYSYSHAYILNWYQTEMEDSRIIYGGEFNYAYEDVLREIVGELFDTQTPNEDVQALCDYFSGERLGKLVRMNANWNAWEAGAFYLGDPYSEGTIMGKTLLMGDVMSYQASSGSYVPIMAYYAYFDQDPDDPGIFRFDQLVVSE
ncbi:MAG: hypothetical protein IJI24_02555 [Lachnospiraceae bacterium]|nr:hypothetical protein [Lachnospiraceae bacterium]